MKKVFSNAFALAVLLGWALPGFAYMDTGTQDGRFKGLLIMEPGESLTKCGEWWYDQVSISALADLYVTAYNGTAFTGALTLHANTICIDGTVDASGRGYRGGGASGGGGGGGGGSGQPASGGNPGSPGSGANPGSGGEGTYAGNGGYGCSGGNGSQGGKNQVDYPGGNGGSGAGSPGTAARNGGYLGANANGDGSEDLSLSLGSGGGGGGGGFGGGGGGQGARYVFAFGGSGGNGGSGGPGGSGGSGGGCVKLFANMSLVINGVIKVSGAAGSCGSGGGSGASGGSGGGGAGGGGRGGDGGAGGQGGHGAGGGILLYSPGEIINFNNEMYSLGGNGSTQNGGTIKLYSFANIGGSALVSTLQAQSGRVYINGALPRRPEAPVLVPPYDDVTTYQNRITVAARYRSNAALNGTIYFQVSRDNTFQSNMMLDAISNTLAAADTDMTVSFPNQLPGTYYWRAQGIDSAGMGSEYSAVGRYEIIGGCSPEITGLNPAAATTGTMASITITGANLPTFAAVSLRKGAQTVWATHYCYASSSKIISTFDLTGANVGDWQLYVHDPGNTDGNKSYGQKFEVMEVVLTPTPTRTATQTPTSTVTPAITVIPDSEKKLRVYHSQMNPCKGELARIRWYQPDNSGVTVEIYNLLGKKIMTLANKRTFAAGQIQEILWDGRGGSGSIAGSGIYLVCLQAGNYQARAKIAVVK